MRSRSPLQAIGGGLFFIVLALAFLLSRYSGALFLPVLFVGLAITSLVSSMSTGHPRTAYGGLYGFVWLVGLAFCFGFGFWPWILFVIGISVILGALAVPIMAWLTGLSFMSRSTPIYNSPQQPYQPQPYQQPVPPQVPYEQGYQSPPAQPASETYQEGGQQYPYSAPPQQSYEQPQAQYPQEMPPQQQ